MNSEPRRRAKTTPRLVSKPNPDEWQVDKLVPGGRGFTKLANGEAAFVDGALPGERIRVLEAADHGGYLRATNWSLLEASPERVVPACPIQNQCGGCDWMMLNYDAQVEAKVNLLRDALMRTGRFRALPELRFVPSPDALAYRTRIRLHVSSSGRLGLFAKNSQRVVDVEACLVALPALNHGLSILRELARVRPNDFATLAEVELRAAPGDPALSVHAVPRDPSRPASRSLADALTRSFRLSYADRETDSGPDQRYPLPEGVELRAPAGAFTQVNWAVNTLLVQALLEGAEHAAARRFCDLYCGAGNFSLPLFARGLSGVGIEGARVAVAAAQRAAAHHTLDNARFIAGDVLAELERLPREPRFDLVVLDPPRTGARAVLPEIIRRLPPHVAYCACDPVTLARDLRTLCDAGYALDRVTGFDMFPQTHHFETLAWLTLTARRS